MNFYLDRSFLLSLHWTPDKTSTNPMNRNKEIIVNGAAAFKVSDCWVLQKLVYVHKIKLKKNEKFIHAY